MTTDGTAPSVDTAQLLSTMFALVPIPVAVVDDQSRIVIANSAFNETFQDIPDVGIIQREVEIPGRGAFDLQTVPLNEQGFKIVYAVDVTDRSRLRRRVASLERLAAVGSGAAGVVRDVHPPPEDDVESGALLRAERARRRLENLMVLAGVAAPRRGPIDLNEIVRHVLAVCGYLQPDQRFNLTLELDRNLSKAAGDAYQIEQVVRTLVLNAENALTPHPGKTGAIYIRTLAHAGRVQLHVSHNGAGRGAVHVEPARGCLGIDLCAEIVKDQGGEMYAWSPNSAGSTFTLELPVYIHALDEAEPAAALGACLQGKRVLVIDDEIHAARFVADVLHWHGAHIEVAGSGSEAYEHLRSKKCDLVICGRLFRGLTGRNLHRLLESWAPPEAKRRYLFITEDAGGASHAGRASSQADVSLLRKPFRVQDLLEAVDVLFSRNRPHDS